MRLYGYVCIDRLLQKNIQGMFGGLHSYFHAVPYIHYMEETRK